MTNNLGSLIREIRMTKKLSQVEVGKRLGYTSQFVANWERGKSKPPKSKIKELSEILKVNKNKLINAYLEDIKNEF